MREPRLSPIGRRFVRLVEKIGFTVLTGAGALIAFFTGHPVIAFAMTVWAVIEAKGAIKAFWLYQDEPRRVTIIPNECINENEVKAKENE